MKLLGLFVALLAIAWNCESAAAQCCCSRAEVTITNGAGFALDAGEIVVREVSERGGGNRAAVLNDKTERAKIHFRIGCGTGREIMVVEHQGVEMRIRFKLLGDFGHAELDVPFAQGDQIIEFDTEPGTDGKRKAVSRQAGAEEVKEAEEIQQANAAAKDKAADAPGSDPSP